MKKTYLLDTSVIIDSVDNIKTLSDRGENLIVITDIVLSEADHLKNNPGTVGYMARRFNNFLQDAAVLKIEQRQTHTITIVQHGDVLIHLITPKQYEEGFHNNYQSVVNDRRIIEVAEWVNSVYENVVVISNDVAFRNFALTRGLQTESLRVVESDLEELEFFKEIVVPYEYLATLHLKSIRELESELALMIPEECASIAFKQEFSDHQVLGNVINGKIEILDEAWLRECKLVPRNREQLFYANLIRHPSIDIVISSSPSGSGKTAVAVANAMKLIDAKNSPYSKIVYIRNPIDSVDRDAYIGFKKGDMDEKIGGFFTPLYDALESFALGELKRSGKGVERDVVDLKVNEYIQRYNMSFPYIGNLRGSNLADSVIIIDEAQNFSLSSMQLVLTRITDGSKVIVIGDTAQVDSIYLSKLNNALTFLLSQTKIKDKAVSLASITMPKSIRGRICEWSEEVFSKHK